MKTIEEHWLHSPVAELVGRLDKKGLAVDIGANTGSWTQWMAGEFDNVLAIEPDTRASVDIPAAKNVTVMSAAVTEEGGFAPLFLRKTTGHNSLLESHPIGGDGMAPVPPVAVAMVFGVKMDDLFPEGADLVKMDIEGGEASAMRGFSADGRWKRTAFVVECHDTFADVSRELDRLGKRVTRIPHPLHAHPGHCWAIGAP